MQMIIVYVRHRRGADADLLARELTLRLRQLLGTRVLGPDEPPVARVQGLFIRRIILKLERKLPIARIKQNLLSMRADLLAQKAFASGQILFDVDPL